MQFKRIIFLISVVSLLSTFSIKAANVETPNSNTNMDSGFNFSPIAHAQTADLLEFIASYGSLNKEQQQSTYMEVVEALAKDKEDTKLKIKHAVILSLPSSTLRDEVTAAEHLKALSADQTLSESNANLVDMLHTFTTAYNTELQKSRDASKKAVALKQKNKALGQKLKDLKNIEKTMIERNAKVSN